MIRRDNPFSPGSFLHSAIAELDEPTPAPPPEPFLPSAEFIATETAKLRADWSDREHRRRGGLSLEAMVIPSAKVLGEGGVS